ncbi:AAA domain-containing protein [Streptomyces sp. NPDC050610]|uniref:DEAD/DEAH box helicase n=1 Tax=Streptomyces sp. NPDC050610 TaxID=3157097 RepID=UPI00343B0862
MSVVTVSLRAPLVLVPGYSFDEQLRKKAGTGVGLPDSVDRVLADLNALRGGVAALLDVGGDATKPSLMLHTRNYRLKLEPTDRRTGYLIRFIDPVRLSDHARLAQSCLVVRPHGWRLALELRGLPDDADAYWEELVRAWHGLGEERAEACRVPRITEAQEAYLDSVDRVIDATEEIATRYERRAAPFPYGKVLATGGRRNTPSARYEFLLVGAERPSAGAFVCLQGDSESRGQVERVEDRSVTVRFDQPVSWEDLPQRGALEITPNAVVYRKQRQAVAALRARDTSNHRLLDVLVEHRVRAIPGSSARPREQLDPEQLEAFRRALTTEDLLVVLGPPGTGKTRTIAEIAQANATAGGPEPGRVLVTSQTNRAVDNVLARLSRELVVVRVGTERKVHHDVKPLLLENLAENVSQEIQHAMTGRVQAYRDAEAAAPWAVELAERIERANSFVLGVRTAAAQLREAVGSAGGLERERLSTLESEQATRREAGAGFVARSTGLGNALCTARRRSDARLTGWFHRLRSRRLERKFAVAEAAREHEEQVLVDLDRAVEVARDDMDRAVEGDPSVCTARDAKAAVERERDVGLLQAYEAADMAVAALSTVVHECLPPVRSKDAEEALGELGGCYRQLERWRPVIIARRQLAEEWAAAAGEGRGLLQRELLRYAQVVGATCIGAASRSELSGVDFDLGIVDEAGQIGVADALVPLSRVRRGVLVGDDRQLPPFVDSEAADWGRGIDDPGVLDLLSRSALERLRAGLPGSHVVELTRQRRMPREIADFISSAFYRGRLVTEKEHLHGGPLFASPMAFVDTGDLQERVRHESAGRRAEERYGRKGVFNTCEARLLALLAAYYHGRGIEWVIIVPYLAQRAAVLAQLSPLIGDSELAEASVGSVDSYQGGERDTVLYGFTRSNSQGRVGFLKELRRANVAFSRAQRQLVMVGDLSTLLRADDPGFRGLAEELHLHLLRCGDLSSYRDVMKRITEDFPGAGIGTEGGPR